MPRDFSVTSPLGSAPAPGSAIAAAALAALLGVALLPAFAPTAAAQGTTTVIAKTGDAAPAGPGTFTSFNASVALNDAGQVAFFAFLGGSGVTTSNDLAIYRFGDAGNVQIAREGAPAGPGHFTSFNVPILNDAGQAAFLAILGGAAVTIDNDAFLYRFGDAGTIQIARNGDPAPTGPGVFRGLVNIVLNDAGQAAFSAGLGGTGVTSANDLALYRFSDAGTVQIARKGNAAPAGPGNFTGFDLSIALNDAGQAVFEATLGGVGVDTTNDGALYRFGNTGTVQIAREGDPVPGGPGNFGVFPSAPLALNDAGQAAFVAGLVGAGINATNNIGLYRFGDAGTVPIARAGDAAPVGPGNFTGFGPDSPALNDAGQAAFRAILAGTGVDSTNNGALYRFGDTGTVQIAREGDAAPAGLGSFTFFDNIALNDAGQAVFLARLGGSGVDATNDRGLYVYDDLLGLIPVAREGDAFLDSTLTSLGFNFSRADEANGFNNLGQVAYQFTLANGNSGIALFTLAAVQPLAGDYNASGQVEQGDLDLVLLNWGRDTNTTGVPAGWANDLPTGLIDQAELDGVLLNWGATAEPVGSSIPEPTIAALLALGTLTLLTRR